VTYHEFGVAIRAWTALADKQREDAIRAVERIQAIRAEIAEEARRRGYPVLCRESIPNCRGECCTVLFPRKITRVDFFIASWGLTAAQSDMLGEILANCDERGNRCPLLVRDGCLLSFDRRPLTCANSYPCFASHGYWEFLQARRAETDAIYREMERIIGVDVSSVQSESRSARAVPTESS